MRAQISKSVAESSDNRFPRLPDERIFEEPLLGFADVNDHLFTEYKRIIGEFHLTPLEWMSLGFPGDRISGGTVICWVLPITEETKKSNRIQTQFPSERWVMTKYCGERFNNTLRAHVMELLRQEGHNALAPALSSGFNLLNDDKVGRTSNWSERHAAYAAGLGTFSLNDGFITEKGIAHRVGSVITDMIIPPTKRKYETHLVNCLHYRSNSCVACVERCPVHAITPAGHDKLKCREYVNGASRDYSEKTYGIKESACGLCQTKVPCESKRP